jgi:DNA-binding CsgD family transcriptional regulator
MTEAVLKLARDRLRVAIVAADPRRTLALSRLMRDLGHEVAPGIEGATVILSDGARVEGDVPVVGLGGNGKAVRAQLPRDATPQQIDAALRAVAVGLSVSVAEEWGAEARGRGFAALTERDEPALLTPRETEVLRDVAEGLTNKEIAAHLTISQHTVKFHLESLMRKLGVSTRAEAVSKSMRLKLLEPYRL